MPAPSVIANAYIADRGFIGLAAETTIGTPVAATAWIQLLDEGLALEPGIIAQKLIRASRSAAFVPVIGEQQVAGKIDTPLYVDQGLLLLCALIGTDTYQSSPSAGTSVAIGGSGVAAGATQIILATQTGTPLAANDYIQLGQAAAAIGDANLQEIHKVSAVTGAGPYTVSIGSETVRNTYSATGRASRIASSVTVFTHTMHPDQPNAATYKTLTIEKNAAGMDSRQHAGATITKGALKLDSKSLATMSYDIVALGDVNVSPSTPVFGTSAPLALANFSLSLFGSGDTSVKTFDLDIDQGAKPEWTFTSGNFPSVAAPVERKITGKWTNIVQSRTYYSNALAGTTGAAALTLTQGLQSITWNLPKFHIDKIADPLKVGSLFYFDIDFMADFDDTTGRDIEVVIVNGTYLPII